MGVRNPEAQERIQAAFKRGGQIQSNHPTTEPICGLRNLHGQPWAAVWLVVLRPGTKIIA
jgi:hypothetical protein